MSMIALWFRKSLTAVAAVALALAALPVAGAYAQAANPPSTPVPGQASASRLQSAWAKEQAVYVRIGTMLTRADGLVSRIQSRIDKVKTSGKDVSAVQSALAAFSSALKDVHSIYDGMKSIFSNHAGFDDSGAVTDPVQALQTVKDAHTQLLAIRQTGIRDAGKALRGAIQAFRQSNSPSTPTPATSG
jgi:hypothetical protein